jgi:hypothetical protein
MHPQPLPVIVWLMAKSTVSNSSSFCTLHRKLDHGQEVASLMLTQSSWNQLESHNPLGTFLVGILPGKRNIQKKRSYLLLPLWWRSFGIPSQRRWNWFLWWIVFISPIMVFNHVAKCQSRLLTVSWGINGDNNFLLIRRRLRSAAISISL